MKVPVGVPQLRAWPGPKSLYAGAVEFPDKDANTNWRTAAGVPR